MKEIYKLARSCKTFDEFKNKIDKDPNPIMSILEESGITIEEIRSRSKKRELVDMRIIISCYLTNTGMSDSNVGLMIRRNRTTVLYYKRIIDDLLEFDPLFREKFNKVIHN